ncbi:hypothetical protein [Nocardia seriolae]|uniref:Uncharacterized protein n=2 Tax=Nocardia seriolae TaxID=37332 RepID=A0A0B8MZH2_9NOCA|nr:hypothetical protein [Nocardia seriolae]APB01696.1 hypothetical protein NS506_07677 [Nocardia seriolae]MTJ60836.1 hypothetical protein [Nocardia seriolae]MTJ76129.1 hypothetical protein [Nocardia seriolae]MTJ91022.1 hypothetical protein [Nocardia seriolae]MTK34984.1 hypothetical protein [Nocardia seriolae]
MDPNITLREIRRLVHGYVELREYAPDRYTKVNGLLFCLTESVTDLDRWLRRGGILPRDWATTSRTVPTATAEIQVIDRTALSAVIGTALEYLREVGVIVGDIDVADEHIVSAIQARWTMLSARSEVSA